MGTIHTNFMGTTLCGVTINICVVLSLKIGHWVPLKIGHWLSM
jgi:hypothetical protein